MTENLNVMDMAVKLATKELEKILTAQQLADWIEEWYLRVGYERLCRIVLRVFPPVQ